MALLQVIKFCVKWGDHCDADTGEDLAARFSGRHFFIVLPDTKYEKGQNVLQRLVGVIRHTQLIIDQHSSPIEIQLAYELISSEGFTTPQAMIDVLQNLYFEKFISVV